MTQEGEKTTLLYIYKRNLVLLKTFPQRKLQAQMTSLVNCINHLQKEYQTYTNWKNKKRKYFSSYFRKLALPTPKPDKHSSKNQKS